MTSRRHRPRDLAGVLAGLYPAWRVCRVQPASYLKTQYAPGATAMEIRPILSALLRNRTGALLVGLQVAITLAVIANAFFIIAERIERSAGRPASTRRT